MHSALQNFHPIVARWFGERFGAPTEPQLAGWPQIAAGRDVLIAAPTGSGKTLAAFLACIDILLREGELSPLKNETRIVYVSPLKALGNDIRKNLEEPLAELRAAAMRAGVDFPEIRAAVRSGDTSPGERAAMLKSPPHILITTPESIYLLLTAQKSREMLKTARTLIVDEIHAVARDKRGAHLALSLERLDRLATRRPARIGLSATQRPIEEIARFLVGTSHVNAAGKPDCVIVDSGHRRELDLAVEIPGEELGAVASKELWEDIYNRVADLVREHRSTLVFVNTRRMVERATHALAKRLGEESVAAHHGSLSKETRFKAESQLKSGQTKAVIATASLELGIDVGAVDLVCQIGSPRSLAVGLQRVGRAGHAPSKNQDGVGELVLPKGRLFPASRDELVECAAFVRGALRGNLEKTSVMPHPLDVLAQQIVATVACEEIPEEALFELVRGAWSYAQLPREEFSAVVTMLAEGIATSRGSRGAWLHWDGVTKSLRPRRGARLVALTSGGAIPDNFTYAVVKEPEGTFIGSLEEDFAVESLSGDIFLLGNSSWRIRRVEAGRVRVEDAHGQPPTIPFWLGEAPGRSAELSVEVSELRRDLEPMLDATGMRLLEAECGLPPASAAQVIAYLTQAKIALSVLPTQETLVAERFFDEGGGMQLVLHAPFGGRLNRAFGLALRKKFCAGFNFELQAAATDDGILLSLGPQHSFPLESVFDFLSSKSLKDTLEQAILDAPVFGVRWRWNATRALALLRQMGGKRVPPAIQRMRSDDLLASVFPDQAACQENVTRPIKIPDHPLIVETMRNCLYEAMDLNGLQALLQKIENREIRLLARDTPTPSPLSHEILNSNPYTYLDDAPLEERRARAVSTRRVLSEDDLKAFGALDEDAIAGVETQNWPDVRSLDELADALRELVLIPKTAVPLTWKNWLNELLNSGRVLPMGETHFASLDRREIAERALQNDETAVAQVLGAWLRAGGPATVEQWAVRTELDQKIVEVAVLRLESAGSVLRGRFRKSAIESGIEEWCDRDVLARIHRRCLSRLRQEMAPVSTAEFVRYLLRWQHVAPGTQVHGSIGLIEVISQLQGLQLPAAAWEKEIFPARIADYDPAMLDELCMNGTVVWGRLLPGRADEEDNTDSVARRRATPNRNTTISVLLREDLPWILASTLPAKNVGDNLGESARELLRLMAERGAMFFNELQGVTGRLRTDLDQALWELVAAGAITCDGFTGLRNLVNPSRCREKRRLLERYPRARGPLFVGGGGRWSLLRPSGEIKAQAATGPLGEPAEIEALADQYLLRWGVVFRDVLAREPFAPPWRVLLSVCRRLEARGEIRGGRFVSGFSGEQFALPEAVEALRNARRADAGDYAVSVSLSAADPLNVTGYLTPPPRISGTLANRVTFLGGVPQSSEPIESLISPQGSIRGA